MAEKSSCHDQGAGIDSIKRRPPEFQDFRAEPFKLDGAADHCADAGVAHGRFFQQPRKIAARDRRGRGLSLTPVRAAAAAPAGGPGACAPRQCFCRSAACAWGTLMLPHRAYHRAQKIAVLSHHRFDLTGCPVTVLSGHGLIFQLVVTCSQLVTMTSLLFAELSGHYRRDTSLRPTLRQSLCHVHH